jgi:hypothetical protein
LAAFAELSCWLAELKFPLRRLSPFSVFTSKILPWSDRNRALSAGSVQWLVLLTSNGKISWKLCRRAGLDCRTVY